MIKILKTTLILLGILVCVAILFAAFHLYKAFKSGDIKSYFMKYAVESVVDESKLSPTQVQYLEAGDFENLAKDIEENITQEQVDCAVEAVGEERASEIMIKQNPTPEEILKLSKCL